MTQREKMSGRSKYGTLDSNWAWDIVQQSIAENLVHIPGYVTAYNFKHISCHGILNDDIIGIMNDQKNGEFFIVTGVVNTKRWRPDLNDHSDGVNKHCVAYHVSTNNYWEPFNELHEDGTISINDGKRNGYGTLDNDHLLELPSAPMFWCNPEERFLRKIDCVHQLHIYREPIIDLIDTDDDDVVDGKSSNRSYTYPSSSSSISCSSSSSSSSSSSNSGPDFEQIEQSNKRMKSILFNK